MQHVERPGQVDPLAIPVGRGAVSVDLYPHRVQSFLCRRQRNIGLLGRHLPDAGLKLGDRFAEGLELDHGSRWRQLPVASGLVDEGSPKGAVESTNL